MIEVDKLSRTYSSYEGTLKKKKRTVLALDDISFHVNQGEVFGLLGPNGAGKTTVIKILTTLLSPTNGKVRVLGLDPYKNEYEIRKKINFIFGGERSLYWRLSGLDNLKYFADLYLIPRKKQNQLIQGLLEITGLSSVQNRKVETYSKGMKQRLHIARSLINDPDIIFLDEPTLGLDPQGAIDLRELILDLKARRKTMILTTHNMPEAEKLCDKIAIINEGKIIVEDTISSLKKKILLPTKINIPMNQFSEMELDSMKRIRGFEKMFFSENYISLVCDNPKKIMDHIIQNHEYSKWYGIHISEITLEDIYLEIIKGRNGKQAD